MTGTELFLLGEHLQYERRRRQPQYQAANDRRFRVKAERPRDCRYSDRGGEYLSGAEAENHAPHDPKTGRLEFEPDDEQQKYDAELRKVKNVVGITEKGKSERANDDAGSEVTEDGPKT